MTAPDRRSRPQPVFLLDSPTVHVRFHESLPPKRPPAGSLISRGKAQTTLPQTTPPLSAAAGFPCRCGAPIGDPEPIRGSAAAALPPGQRSQKTLWAEAWQLVSILDCPPVRCQECSQSHPMKIEWETRKSNEPAVIYFSILTSRREDQCWLSHRRQPERQRTHSATLLGEPETRRRRRRSCQWQRTARSRETQRWTWLLHGHF